MSWFLKTRMLNATCFIIALLLFSPPVFAGKTGSYKFINKLLKTNSKQLKRITKQIPDSSLIKKVDISKIKKSLPNINVTKLSPDVLRLAAVGGQIAKSSKFANRFINQAPNPAEIILQYSKYGKSYLKTAQTFSKTVVTHAGDLSKASAKRLKKFGNLSKDTIAKFKKETFANSAFVTVVRRTGKKGYETIKKITKWAANNPGKTGAAALLIWYATDPEGCTDSIRDVAEFLAEGASDIIVKSTEGIGKGLSASLTKMWEGPIREHFLTGTLLLIAIIILCSRITRRLIFFPLRIVGDRLNSYMDKREANIGHRKQRRDKKVKQENPQVKKGQPESSSSKLNDDKAKGLF